jgi:hypothetical protein
VQYILIWDYAVSQYYVVPLTMITVLLVVQNVHHRKCSTVIAQTVRSVGSSYHDVSQYIEVHSTVHNSTVLFSTVRYRTGHRCIVPPKDLCTVTVQLQHIHSTDCAHLLLNYFPIA